MAGARSVGALLEEAEELPYGFARTALVEQAVREADLAGDLEASFTAREHLLSTAQHGGEPNKAMVAVTWCLAQIDAHPGRFDVRSTYWALKWLPFSLLRLPDAPLSEVEKVVGEAERRYRAEGTGADAVAKLAWEVPLRTGHVEQAVEAHRRWRLLPRSEYSDCRACDVSGEVDLALAADDSERALDVARPLLGGRLECAEEPHRAVGGLLAPLAALGRLEEAERLHTWGERLSRGNPSLLSTQAEHVAHLVRTDRVGEAADWLTDLVSVCDRGVFDADARMRVYATGAAVAAALADAGVGEPPRPLGARPQATSDLARVLAAEARGIASAFDRRNGTGLVGAQVEAILGTRPRARVPGAVATVPAQPADAAPPPPPDVTGTTSDDPAGLLHRAREDDDLSDVARLELVERAMAGFTAAGDVAGAARARRSRARLRLRLGDDGAVADLEAAVGELEDQPVEQLRGALLRARLAYSESRRVEDAERWLDVARAAARRADDPAAAGSELRVVEAELAMLEADDDEGARAAAAAMYAEARAASADDAERLSDAWASEGWSRSVVGDLDGALAATSSGWELAREREDDEALAGHGGHLAHLLGVSGDLDRALKVLAEVQAAQLRQRQRAAAAATALNRAQVLADADRDEQALAAAFEAADLFASAGDRSGAAWARLTAGRCFRALDADQSAYDIWSELVEQARDDGDPRLEGAVALDLARLDADYGHDEEALDHGRRALASIGDDEPGDRARVWRMLARVHASLGDEPAALDAGAEALAGFEADGDEGMLAIARAEQADRLVVAGRGEEALELYAAARAVFETEERPSAVGSVDLGRADALASLGRAEEAVTVAEAVAELGRQEGDLALVADGLWAAASHSQPDVARYEHALIAYERSGAPPEQLAFLREQRDERLKQGRGLFRRR